MSRSGEEQRKIKRMKNDEMKINLTTEDAWKRRCNYDGTNLTNGDPLKKKGHNYNNGNEDVCTKTGDLSKQVRLLYSIYTCKNVDLLIFFVITYA